MKVLIAGGTGLIGSRLYDVFCERGHSVKILTRKPSAAHHIFWDPSAKKIDTEGIADTEVLINLCGTGIADKRWTPKRKREIIESRTMPIQFLGEQRTNMPHLKQFISASGISCYGFEPKEEGYIETDPFGTTFIDRVVEHWEARDSNFDGLQQATLRIAIVLSDQGGAVNELVRPMRWNLGAALGSGKQIVPWIAMDDVTALFLYAAENNLAGTYNAVAGNATNRELTQTLARRLGKKIWLPNVPGFMMKLLLGELAIILLKGVNVSNKKLSETGFQFTYKRLEDAVEALEL